MKLSKVTVSLNFSFKNVNKGIICGLTIGG